MNKSATSTGEMTTLNFFNRAFGVKFKKVRPDWLRNPRTGAKLELDGYSKSLNIAFEYGSHKPAHKNSYIFSDQEYVKYKDSYKIRKCREQGVRLIQVPDIKSTGAKREEIFKTILLKEFNRLGIKVPNKFHSTKLIIKEIPAAYSKEEVWKVVNSCKNRNYFERNFRGYWRAAERLGIIEDVVSYFKSISPRTPYKDINLEMIKKIALKCKTRSELAKTYSAIYKRAIALKVLDEVCEHMDSVQRPWKYWERNWKGILSSASSKSEIRKKYVGLIEFIRRNEEARLVYNKLIDGNKKCHVSKKECLADARKHMYRSKWKISSSGIYKWAEKNGWLNECIAHMNPPPRD